MLRFASSLLHTAALQQRAGRFAGLAAFALVSIVLLAGCTVNAAGIHTSSSSSTTSRSAGAATTSSSANGVTVQGKVVRGAHGATLVLVPVTINGTGPYVFALDTGASTSLISRSIAQKLHLPQDGSRQSISGVGGTAKAVPVKVAHWSIGKLHLPAMSVSSSGTLASNGSGGTLQGLIGSDIWRQFGTLTIDYNNGKITVPRQIASVVGSAPIALRETARVA